MTDQLVRKDEEVETALDPVRGQSRVVVLDGDDAGDVDLTASFMDANRDSQAKAFDRIAKSYARVKGHEGRIVEILLGSGSDNVSDG